MEMKGLHVGLVCRSDVESAIDLANSLHEAGIAVTLYLSFSHVAMAVGDSDQPIQSLYELGLVPPTCNVRLRRIPRMRSPKSFGMAYRLAATMRSDGVTLAHILMGPGEMWLAVLATLLWDIPVTSTMVIPEPNTGEPLPNWLLFAAYRLLALGSTLIVVNGRSQVSLVQRLYGVGANRVAYVPLHPRTTAVKWARHTIEEEPGTVLFFGAAHPHKGLEYLVRAQPGVAQHVPHARILVASRGEDLTRCLKLIHDPDGFEIREGYVTGEEMGELFQRASLVVLPYITASTSGILLTAYGYTKPVVATRVGCLPEYVRDEVTGLLVPPADTGELEKAIVRLLTDDNGRRQMGANAKQWVEGIKVDALNQVLSNYERCIGMFEMSRLTRLRGLFRLRSVTRSRAVEK